MARREGFEDVLAERWEWLHGSKMRKRRAAAKNGQIVGVSDRHDLRQWAPFSRAEVRLFDDFAVLAYQRLGAECAGRIGPRRQGIEHRLDLRRVDPVVRVNPGDELRRAVSNCAGAVLGCCAPRAGNDAIWQRAEGLEAAQEPRLGLGAVDDVEVEYHEASIPDKRRLCSVYIRIYYTNTTTEPPT